MKSSGPSSEYSTIDFHDAPVVTCGPDAIRVKGESEDVFEGQIFIKNQRRSTDCFVVYSEEQNSTTPEFSLPLTRLSSCGIDIRRNPTRGLELFSVFVFAFHPSFVTAGDRAFAVHCLFQQEQITVSARFDFISDITPKALLGSTSSLPKINFQIVQGRVPTGEKVAGQVHVGQPLMLVWTLEETSKLYGLRMLDCTAETHDGRGMSIIRDGCTIDDMLISDIRYSEDYRRAFADATAFKFPDLSDVWFKCMARFCIRKSDHLLLTGASEYHLCGNISKCDVKSLRVRRSTTSVQDHYDENVIMVTGRLTVDKDAVFYNYAAQVSSPETSTVCLAKDTVALGSAVSMTICASTILTVASLIYSKVKITSSPR
ncbi:ZP domain-containing protein [Trichostrongylus colubriformis]|uniref:ZP domain-containing protein n=1 Tax=Trichostrongylus colubriformis TaxID=6319 RepID=A0AAN8IQ37_TRICO